MKKAILRILGLFFALCMLSPAQGQSILNKLGKKLQDKANRKVEERVDQKVDEQVDKTLDKAFESDSSKIPGPENSEAAQQARMGKLMKGLGMTGEPAKFESSYTFQSKVQMHLEHNNADGEKSSEGEFLTWVNTGKQNFAYEFVSGTLQKDGNARIIMDIENKSMIILTDKDNKKSGIAYGFDPESLKKAEASEAGTETGNQPDYSGFNQHLQKTGRTKTIAGYVCDEYHYDNPEEDTEGNFWLSQDADISTRDMMTSIFKSASYSTGMPRGFVMEAESWSKTTKERSFMQVTDIDKNAHTTFDLSSYQVTNLGSMKIPAGQGE